MPNATYGMSTPSMFLSYFGTLKGPEWMVQHKILDISAEKTCEKERLRFERKVPDEFQYDVHQQKSLSSIVTSFRSQEFNGARAEAKLLC